ncbi:MAG: universal stress protein [Gammaproteobacteria bacterium]|nr:universal stress protein [Gammaproteobacteria bacterium]
MISSKNVLLSSHGTDGAQAAERAAIAMCETEATIKHLLVVPDLWKDMMGDDWLNNGSTRDRYGRYIESELGKEIDTHISRVRQQAEEKGIHYHCEVILGKPDKCLANACKEAHYDMVIMGSPRPKGVAGLRSRMTTGPLAETISSPLLIVPYPDE